MSSNASGIIPEAADIYSAGIWLFVMMVGIHPYVEGYQFCNIDTQEAFYSDMDTFK